MTSRSSALTVGDRVQVIGAYLDERLTLPVLGEVSAMHGRVFVVMFEHTDPSLPPGGEFTGDRLELVA